MCLWCMLRPAYWGPWSPGIPCPYSGAIAGNPLGVDRELLQAGEAPCPSSPGRSPLVPARTCRHTQRGRGLDEILIYYLWILRLESQGKAHGGVQGAGVTQGSCLYETFPPLPTSPHSSSLKRDEGGGGWATWLRVEEAPSATRTALLPSPFPTPPELNFGAITVNSMDATSERDFVGESSELARLSSRASPLHCVLLPLSPAPDPLQPPSTPI